MKLNKDSSLFIQINPIPSPVQYAIRALKQDWQAVFGAELRQTADKAHNQIRLSIQPHTHDEGFRIIHEDDYLLIEGHDDCGLVYGIYYLCESVLGIDPFAFWTDFQIPQASEIAVPFTDYQSIEPAVRFRGWFVNDEDCLIGWHDNMIISPDTWEKIFESLLRADYNTVIPGTVIDSDDPVIQLATDMGLWLAQHHAEPLGARLFRTAYPGITPRIPEDIARFEALYLEAIHHLKDKKVLWSLGFRGQGDVPFFVGDSRYSTPEQQGKVIGDMIRLQRKLIEDNVPAPHYFTHQVYSESAALYREGHLLLDDDVIRVWADNGYGAMRARREWSPDPEVLSYPLEKDSDKQSGVYYHVQFHDLQTAHRITPFVAPQLIVSEFQKIFEAGNIACVIVNTGNIRPHVFNLELLSRILHGYSGSTEDIFERHEQAWATRYFPEFEEQILELLYRYHRAFFPYGEHEDDKGGEELCHWGTRFAIRAVVRNQSVFDTHFSFPFLNDKFTTNHEVFRWLIERLKMIMPEWKAIEQSSHEIEMALPLQERVYYKNLMKRHILYMRYSYGGFLEALYGVMAFMDEDYQTAFIHFSDSKAFMEKAWSGLIDDDKPKWTNFYRGEWLTGVRESIRWLETIRGLCRIHGDTESWWSGWMLEAMGMEKEIMLATINQALTDYDTLARALKMRREGKTISIDSLLG